MKHITFSLIAAILLALAVNAQKQVLSKPFKKTPIYAEVGIGFGQTLFFANTKSKLSAALGGTFDPGIGNNLMVAFYAAPEKWKGLGIGSRIKGTFGTSVEGDFGDDYLFNYYNLAVSAKYYPITRIFNRGPYTRLSAGFGQFTSKRVKESAQIYIHQYGIGSSLMGGIGWTFPLRRTSLSIEAEFEYSGRNGTVDKLGDARFASGQIGGNIILSF